MDCTRVQGKNQPLLPIRFTQIQKEATWGLLVKGADDLQVEPLDFRIQIQGYQALSESNKIKNSIRVLCQSSKRIISYPHQKKQKWVNMKNTEIQKFSCMVVTRCTILILPTFRALWQEGTCPPHFELAMAMRLALTNGSCLAVKGTSRQSLKSHHKTCQGPLSFLLIMKACFKLQCPSATSFL